MADIKTAEKNEILTEEELDKVSGGGLSLVDEARTLYYQEAGIKFERTWLGRQGRYTITENGQEKRITQEAAEKIAFAYHGKDFGQHK